LLDRSTGLRWQTGSGLEPALLAEAASACEALELAGSDDWRLPTVAELETLLDGSPDAAAGMVGLLALTGAEAGPHWALGPAGAVGAEWFVSYGGHGFTSYGLQTQAYKFRARCVRQEFPALNRTGPRFVQQPDGSVVDTWFSRTWQMPANAATARTHVQAVAWCKAQSGGYHLPSIGELRSVLNRRSATSPPFEPNVFAGLPDAMLWSASQAAAVPDAHLAVMDFLGPIFAQSNDTLGTAWCVRQACPAGYVALAVDATYTCAASTTAGRSCSFARLSEVVCAALVMF